jgi:hypothetical protein
MKILDVVQGTPEWHIIRCGKPTASNFGKILTATGKASTSAQGYMDSLLADWLAGEPADAMEATFWMERGVETEDEARQAYSIITGREVQQVGFCMEDGERWGCSPDGLVGGDGGLEIKCPKASTLISYYRSGCPAEYRPQIQGCMMVTDRAWWDFMGYHPSLRPLIVRVERDEQYIIQQREALEKFVMKMEEQKESLKEWRL